MIYPPTLAYLTGGSDGLRRWARAKFLNQTTTDPGIGGTAYPSAPPRGAGRASGRDVAAAVFGTGPSRHGPNAGGSGAGAGAAIAFATAQLGKPYRWGATGPNAFDCSGLVQAAWRHGGVQLPRTSTLMLGVGRKVTRAQLVPGDLVWPALGHVQLYIGGGQVIEAPRTGLSVRRVALGTVWTARHVAPRRRRDGGAVAV